MKLDDKRINSIGKYDDYSKGLERLSRAGNDNVIDDSEDTADVSSILTTNDVEDASSKNKDIQAERNDRLSRLKGNIASENLDYDFLAEYVRTADDMVASDSEGNILTQQPATTGLTDTEKNDVSKRLLSSGAKSKAGENETDITPISQLLNDEEKKELYDIQKKSNDERIMMRYALVQQIKRIVDDTKRRKPTTADDYLKTMEVDLDKYVDQPINSAAESSVTTPGGAEKLLGDADARRRANAADRYYGTTDKGNAEDFRIEDIRDLLEDNGRVDLYTQLEELYDNGNLDDESKERLVYLMNIRNSINNSRVIDAIEEVVIEIQDALEAKING